MGFGVPCCWLLGWEGMSLGKILLFYKFTPIADPQAMRLWQRDLCELLGLTGRILISEHGINGTLGGDMEDCKRYVRFGSIRGLRIRSLSGRLVGPMIFRSCR